MSTTASHQTRQERERLSVFFLCPGRPRRALSDRGAPDVHVRAPARVAHDRARRARPRPAFTLGPGGQRPRHARLWPVVLPEMPRALRRRRRRRRTRQAPPAKAKESGRRRPASSCWCRRRGVDEQRGASAPVEVLLVPWHLHLLHLPQEARSKLPLLTHTTADTLHNTTERTAARPTLPRRKRPQRSARPSKSKRSARWTTSATPQRPQRPPSARPTRPCVHLFVTCCPSTALTQQPHTVQEAGQEKSQAPARRRRVEPLEPLVARGRRQAQGQAPAFPPARRAQGRRAARDAQPADGAP